MLPNYPLSVLGKKIAFSTIVQYGGKIVQLVLAAVSLKLISNFLSHGQYGDYAAINEYALFFSVAANLGIFAHVVRKMADRPHDDQFFTNALVLRIVTALLFFGLAVVLALLKGSDPLFLGGTIIFGSALLFDLITSVCDGMLQANYLMGRATIALIAGRIVQMGITFLLIKKLLVVAGSTGSSVFDSSIMLLFWAPFLGSLVTMGLSLFFVRRKFKFHLQWNQKFMFGIIRASLPFGIITLINSLYFRFLPEYFSHEIMSPEQFGSFNIFFRVAQVLSLFSTFLMFSVLPGMKEYIDARHWQKVRELYGRVWKVLLVSGMLLVGVGSLLGPWMVKILSHQKYLLPELWFLLPLMLILAAISYGYDLILITLFALEQDKWLLKMELLALLAATVFFVVALAGQGEGVGQVVAGQVAMAGNVFLPESVPWRILLILIGAIVGESVMVTVGILKVRRLLAQK